MKDRRLKTTDWHLGVLSILIVVSIGISAIYYYYPVSHEEKPQHELEGPQHEQSVMAHASSLTGRIAIVEPSPVPQRSVNGHCYATVVYSGGRLAAQHVSIKGGLWSVLVPQGFLAQYSTANPRLFFHNCLINGCRVRIIESHGVLLSRNNSVEMVITGKQLPKVTVHLFDAGTGETIHQCSVIADRADDASVADHPGDTAFASMPITTNADGQCYLPPTLTCGDGELSSAWIGAPGYAWSHIGTNDHCLSRCIVGLQRAGSLTVALPVRYKCRSCWLRVFRDRRLYTAIPLGETKGSVSIDGIMPGTYSLRLDQDLVPEIETWNGSVTHDEQEVVVRAGTDIKAVLRADRDLERRVRAALSVEKGSASGQLIVPSEWSLDRYVLMVTPAGRRTAWRQQGPLPEIVLNRDLNLNLTLEPDSVFPLRVDGIPLGEYLLTVRPPGVAVPLSVLQGNSSVSVRVPKPCHMEITGMDNNGRTVPVEWAFWSTSSLPASASLSEDGPRVGLKPGSFPHWYDTRDEIAATSQAYNLVFCSTSRTPFQFRVPVGPIRLVSMRPGYVSRDVVVTAKEGANRATLRYDLRFTLQVRLVCNDSQLLGLSKMVRIVNDDNSRTYFSSIAGVSDLDGPGVYIVHVDSIPGFNDTLPLKVLIADSGHTIVDVAMSVK